VGVRGEVLLEPPEESREWAGEHGRAMLSSCSLLKEDVIRGKEKERSRLILGRNVGSRRGAIMRSDEAQA
jgi:hypothetical protein